MGNGDQQYEKVPEEIEVADNRRRSLEVPAHQYLATLPPITSASSSEPPKVRLPPLPPSFHPSMSHHISIPLLEHSVASTKFCCSN
jgi:hypothetical protein